MMRQQIQSLSDLYDQRPQKISTLPQLIVQRFVLDHIKLIIFIDLVFPILLVDIIKHVAQRTIATLIDNEGTRIHDGVGEHLQQVEDTRTVQELFFGLAVLEEEVTEPDLSEVGLILVGSVDLFDCVEGFGLEVEALPDFRETSTAELLATEITINEGLVLEDGLVVGSFEDRLLVALFRWVFVSLSLVAYLPFVSLTLRPDLAD